MTEEDIRAELLNAAAVAAVVDTRIFADNPLSEQTAAYITLGRDGRKRDIVSDHSRFRIWAYSQNKTEMLGLIESIIELFEGKRLFNNQEYYAVNLLNNFTGDGMLKNGFYWSILDYQLKKTT